MRIGWWAEVSLSPSTFVFGTPNNHAPLIHEARRRGHSVELIHVPWKQNGAYVFDDLEFKELRPVAAFDAAVNRRKRIENIVKKHSGLDATMRGLTAAAAACHCYEPGQLPYDVIFMKLPPPGFFRTKLEVVYNLWRFTQANVPVFCFDGDLMWEHAAPWLTHSIAPPGICGTVHARTPYFPRKALPRWEFWPYFYHGAGEVKLGDPARAYDLGYVGNDWRAQESPRAAALVQFYGHGDNRIWGRWTAENIKYTGLRDDLFGGPVPANAVEGMYSQCKASVALGLPEYLKRGLVTQRYREILRGGAMLLIDAAYSPGVTNLYCDAQFRVKSSDEALDWARQPARDGIVEDQREYVRSKPELKLDRWINELERLATRRPGDV